MDLPFDNTYFRDLRGSYVPMAPEPYPAPALVIFNEGLASELGLDVPTVRTHAAGWFGGTTLPAGANPLAQAYAGHQFGGFSPQLGDGRALLLGELVDDSGHRWDLHLKGSGRTPFARGGDGRATLGPVLREYLMGEAMHALGVPTTRALAALTTGEQVVRESRLPGAVLARVASSHLRVGTFQFFSARGELDTVGRLVDYALRRHHPRHRGAENPALALLREVASAQAELIAAWMQIGFVHGVMNTDNTTISGETIDYGPCAFMEATDPGTVFSSIDRGGRYAYGNQPGIGVWNLARFAEALLPVLHDDPDAAVALAQEALDTFRPSYEQAWRQGMGRKVGLTAEPDDHGLLTELLAVLHAGRVDFTTFFRRLSRVVRGEAKAAGDLFDDPAAYTAWERRWRVRLQREEGDPEALAAAMDRVNPVYIPRNHKVEEALDAAIGGDLAPFHALLDAITAPFEARAGLSAYAEPAPTGFGPYVTTCGT